MARPFHPDRVQLSGEAIPVPGAEVVGTMGYANYPSFSVSNEGTILISSEFNRYQLTWFSRTGNVLSTVGQPDRYAALRISPDGGQAAIVRVDSSGNRDVWQMDLTRNAQTRITVNGRGFVAVWSPDGQRLAYHIANIPNLYERDKNGVGPEERVLQAKHAVYINDWSPDGRHLMYTETTPEGQGDLWLLPTTGDRKPIPFLTGPFNESHGQFSPDGKWIAYTSDESGHPEVYVQSIPAGRFKSEVSSSGGSFARWRRDGKELFYRALDGSLIATPVRTVPQGLEFGKGTTLFRIVEPLGSFAYPYDFTPDGQRILALAPPQEAHSGGPLTLLVNWQASLKR
jgi:dipeptidyl aminopeptidase/acylaminoacyl peptidase